MCYLSNQTSSLPVPMKALSIFFCLFCLWDSSLIGQNRNDLILTVESVGFVYREYRRPYPLTGSDWLFGYTVSPDVGFFLWRNMAVGVKGLFLTLKDNIGGEYPELHGVGGFITYYPSFLSIHVKEEVPPFSGKYKALDFYPYAQFTWTQVDGYFTGNYDFHRTAFNVTGLRLIAGVDFRVWKNLRIAAAKGVTYYPGIPFYELKWDYTGALSVRYIFSPKSKK